MRIKLVKLFEQICEGISTGSRSGHTEAVRLAEKADQMDLEVPIFGEKLKVEGASTMPPTVIRTRRAKITTNAALEIDDEGDLVVALKRGLIRTAPEITIEMEFERSDPIQAMNTVRDLADDINKYHVKAFQVRAIEKLNETEEK